MNIFSYPLSRYLAGGRAPDNIALLKAEAEKLEQMRSTMVPSSSMTSSTCKMIQTKVNCKFQ